MPPAVAGYCAVLAVLLFNSSYTSVFSFIGACFFNQRSCLRYFNANFSPVNLKAYVANASADPEGGGGDRGSGPPWKITSYMGFISNWTPPPWKKLDPLENVGPPLEP